MTAPTQTPELIVECRWLIPVIPKDSLLENQALAILNGRIIDLCSIDEAQRRYPDSARTQLNSHLVIPGLINVHNHAAMSLLRGYADDYPLQEWLEQHIWPAEGKFVSADFVRTGTRLAAAEMIRSGTTCFADMYFFPETAAEVAAAAGIRARLAFPIMDFPTAWGQGPEEYIDKGEQLIRAHQKDPLITIAYGPHAPYTVSDTPLKRIIEGAQNTGASIQIHLHETQKEVDDALAAGGDRPIRRLHNLGLLSPTTECVHMTALTDEDMDILQTTGAHVVHCPRSNMKLASGFCPVDALLEREINVALGTDGAASNNGQDLIADMQLAALLAKGYSGKATALNAHAALRMATLNGARAMNMEADLGSLEIGKCADLVALKLDALEFQPLYNPVSTLVYNGVTRHVSHVWINGQLRLDDFQLTSLSMADLQEEVADWQQRIASVNQTS